MMVRAMLVKRIKILMLAEACPKGMAELRLGFKNPETPEIKLRTPPIRTSQGVSMTKKSVRALGRCGRDLKGCSIWLIKLRACLLVRFCLIWSSIFCVW